MSPHTDAGALLPCKLCGNPPGQKVGPPALARCINKDCEGSGLGADTLVEWNARQAASQGNAGGEQSEVQSTDKEIAKQIGQYLGMSGLTTGDVAHIRDLVAQSAPVAQAVPDRDAIARIINPIAFTALERSYSIPAAEEFMDMKIAREKADKILALVASPVPSAHCTCGGSPGQPADHHDISCPLAISTGRRGAP